MLTSEKMMMVMAGLVMATHAQSNEKHWWKTPDKKWIMGERGASCDVSCNLAGYRCTDHNALAMRFASLDDVNMKVFMGEANFNEFCNGRTIPDGNVRSTRTTNDVPFTWGDGRGCEFGDHRHDGTGSKSDCATRPDRRATRVCQCTIPAKKAGCDKSNNAAAADFSSKQAMEAGGWSFNWDDTYTFRPNPATYCAGVPAASYCGFRSGQLNGGVHLRLVGGGTATVGWGNSWMRGRVELQLNGKVVATAGPRSIAETTEVAFQDGDYLTLVEKDIAVIVINSLQFSCDILNEGKRCWGACGNKEGKCSFCGEEGLCCQYKWWSKDPRCKAGFKTPDNPDFAKGHALCVRPDTNGSATDGVSTKDSVDDLDDEGVSEERAKVLKQVATIIDPEFSLDRWGMCYIGCFKDDRSRDLDKRIGGAHNVDTCRRECSKLNYTYFSVQYGTECRCGNNYATQSKYLRLDDSKCRRSGYPAGQGGAWANSIYKTECSDDCSIFNGIPHRDGRTCCHHTCGKYCGAKNCHLAPMGGEACCASQIADHELCWQHEETPCTLSEPQGARLCTDVGLDGECCHAGPGKWSMPSPGCNIPNDSLKSVALSKHCTVDLYQHYNYKGWKWTLKGSETFGSDEDDFPRNTVSSFEVKCDRRN